MAVTATKPAPYAPSGAILDLIARHRSRGLPPPVNSDVLARAGISVSLIPRVLQALQTLDLIDDNGAPTPTFDGIRLAPEVEYKKRLEDWLKGTYADVFSFVDPTTDDETRIRDAFRSYQPIGQQDRMVTLFQGLCTAAGLIADKPSIPRPTPAARPRSIVATPRGIPKPPLKNNPAKAPTGLPPALAGLLESLPVAGGGWTSEERKKFLSTFEAVLDFCFPIVEKPRAPNGTTENGGHD